MPSQTHRPVAVTLFLWTALTLFGCSGSQTGCFGYTGSVPGAPVLTQMAEAASGYNPRATSAFSSAPSLLFSGNATVLVPPSVNSSLQGVGFLRQADCSLTEYFLGSYNSSAGTFTVNTVPNYQNYLHTAAQLTTTANQFKSGCAQTMVGAPSANVVYAGVAKNGALIGAGVDYNNHLYTGSLNLATATAAMVTVPAIVGAGTVATADLNGDGVNDLVVNDFGGTNDVGGGVWVLLGNGDGTFAAPVKYVAGAIPGGITLDDFNGDKKLDILVTSSSGYRVLPGNGDGTFGAAVLTATTVGGVSASADLNGDGKKDLVTSGGRVFKGNGDGTFTLGATLTPLSGRTFGTPALGDFNNDGKIDLAFTSQSGIQIFLGNGDATFTGGNVYSSVYGAQNASLTDIDGDGNLDIVVGNGDLGAFGPDLNTGGLFEVLMGNGDGTFQGAPVYAALSANPLLVAPPSFTIGDFNGDGKPDLLQSSGFLPLGFQAGDGKGHFGAVVSLANTLPSFVTAAQLNKDTKLDAVFLDNLNATPSLATAFGNGDGTFSTVNRYSVPSLTNSASGVIGVVAAGDLNADGFADVAVADASGVFVLLNDGTGLLNPAVQVDTITHLPASLTVADLNGDGKPDLVVVDTGNQFASPTTPGSLHILIGNGKGGFATATTFNPGFGVNNAAVGDLNKDGKLDLVVNGYDPSTATPYMAIYLGKGDGTFATPLKSTERAVATGLAIADLNGDGKADVVEGACCGLAFSTVYLGNGDGTFASSPELANGLSTQDVMAVDLNNDGHPDLVTDSTEGGASGIQVFLSLYGSSLSTVASTTTLTVSPNPAASGQTVTLKAAVTGAATVTGTVTFYDGTAVLGSSTLASGAASLTVSTLTAGTHSITAVYAGDTSNAASASTATSLIVNAAPIATQTALSVNPTTAALGTTITITGKVTETSGSGVPTGTVSFYAGTAQIGMIALTSGSATLSATAIPVGANSITAVYGGDSTHAGSTSAAVSLTITTPPTPSFTLALNPASGTIASGASATTTVSVTPVNGFSAATALTCSGLPAHSSCAFSPASVMPSGSTAATSTLTFSTGLSTAAMKPFSPFAARGGIAFAGTFLGLFGLFLANRRRSPARWLALLLLTAGVAVAATGCGGSSSSSTATSNRTPSGTYSIVVTATSGTLTQTSTYTLTVQ